MVFIAVANCESSCPPPVRLFTLVDVVVMILRVWAIYKQSKLILCILLPLYSFELILYLIDRVIFTAQSIGGM